MKSFAILFGIVLFSGSILPTASGHENVDVSFTGPLPSSFANAILPINIPFGQTFIPNANNLVGLDLKVQALSAGLRTVTVEIREGGILGTLVGQTTDTFNLPATGPFIHHFHFDPPVPLTPGLVHAIQVPLVDIFLAGFSSIDPMDPLLYPDGAFFVGGLAGPEPGGATFLLQFDLVFTTYFIEEIVGGELLPIDSTALLLSSAQSFSWMIPVVLSVLGIGLFVVSRKSENS